MSTQNNPFEHGSELRDVAWILAAAVKRLRPGDTVEVLNQLLAFGEALVGLRPPSKWLRDWYDKCGEFQDLERLQELAESYTYNHMGPSFVRHRDVE